ncbi:efflux RND transporter periplasmic adaptor subunit [Lunatimonas salinarum]|uniref:efflux RND transporter periplasmic adaptor subunit n=1 Tax=Lunatimonas salinarum TaxID=1774590 RepID=UPI001ADEEACE|nr:efflux RND transporter periplasmic adaptor subunit [Lunatimonas salinarum]
MERSFSFSEAFASTRFLPVLSGLGIVLVLFTASCSPGNGKDNKADKLLEIPVLSLDQMTIEIPQTYVADIQARQFVEVRSKIEGFIEKIHVDEGQIVKKDQPLFQLTSTEYNELVNSATAKLMQAKAEEKGASLEVERLKILVDKNIFSSSELELAQSRLDMARSAIMESEAMLKNARLGLSYTTIRAPFDGMVDRIPYKTGSLVNSGDLLTNITDIDEIFAYYKITENEYLEYMRGHIDRENFKKESTEGLKNALEEALEMEKEEISLILSDGQIYQHTGELETMEADFEKGTGSIALRVRFPNPDGLLKHGASGKVQMTRPLENIFLIPQKATFEIQDYTYIYLVDENNNAQIRSFRPKGRYGLFYIADDFNEGDKIILEGIQLLKDGVAVSPQATDPTDVYESLETIAQASL